MAEVSPLRAAMSSSRWPSSSSSAAGAGASPDDGRRARDRHLCRGRRDGADRRRKPIPVDGALSADRRRTSLGFSCDDGHRGGVSSCCWRRPPCWSRWGAARRCRAGRIRRGGDCFAIRAALVLVAGVVLGYVTQTEKRIRAEGASIAAIVSRVELRSGLSKAMALVCDAIVRLFDANRAILVIHENRQRSGLVVGRRAAHRRLEPRRSGSPRSIRAARIRISSPRPRRRGTPSGAATIGSTS